MINGAKRTSPKWADLFGGDEAGGVSDATLRVATFWWSGWSSTPAPDLPVASHDVESNIVHVGSDSSLFCSRHVATMRAVGAAAR